MYLIACRYNFSNPVVLVSGALFVEILVVSCLMENLIFILLAGVYPFPLVAAHLEMLFQCYIYMQSALVNRESMYNECCLLLVIKCYRYNLSSCRVKSTL